MSIFINKRMVDIAMKSKNIKTYTELAERLSIDRTQLSNMLNKDYSPIRTNANKLMEELEMGIDDFLKEEISIKKIKYEQIGEQLGLDFDEVIYEDIDYIQENKKYKLDVFDELKEFQPKKNFIAVETFAGAGGLQLGLEKAKINTLAAIELDKFATETLRRNTAGVKILEEDINNIANNGLNKYISQNEIDSVDILSGGYPCQSFSYAGKRKGLADIRGTLFYPYSEILKQINPKIFIAENVKGLTTHDKGKTLYTMIKVFEKQGYIIYWNIFSAWDYNVAQKRERIFIIGIREDLKKKENTPFKFPAKLKYRPVLKDVLKDVPESPGMEYSDKKREVMKLVPPGGCWVDLPEEVAKEYMGKSYYSGGGKRGMARRLSWDEPSLTLTTSPNQKQTERCHPDETRPLRVREYARIQGFPDNWEFFGGVGNQYKQIGNAVPVNLAQYIGLSVNKYLSQF